MARVEGVSDERAGLLARITFWFAKQKVGRVPEPVRVVAHATPVMMAYGSFELANERATRVDAKLKALASIKTATLIGCPW